MIMRNSNTQIKNENKSKKSGRVMDFVAKILCLAVAFGIWFYVKSTDVVILERDFTVPVAFEKEAALYEETGWSVLTGKENSIVVTIKGKRNIINQVKQNDLYAFVDLSEVEAPGRQTLEIKIDVPSECEVVNTSVANLSPYVDKKVTKNVPINVVYADYVISSNCQLDDPVMNISEITLTGPESELSRVKEARADLYLGNVTQTVNTASALKLISETGEEVESNYITLSSKSVNVSVRLFATKDVPLTVGYKYGFFNDSNVKVAISPAFVTLRGEPSRLDEIESINIATLDEKKFITNSTQNVSITAPTGTTLMSTESAAVIGVEHINTGTKQISVKNITLANSGGLDCKLQTESLNIMLRGPFDVLSKITEADLSVTADMKNYSAGSGLTVVPATVKISSQYEGVVYELESYTVTVNIK